MLLVLVQAGVIRAAPAWTVLQTPQFTVLSQLREKPTRAWAGEFSQFMAALGTVVQAHERTRPPLTILLFNREKDFRAYQPRRPDGKRQEYAGLFTNRDAWGVIGLLGDNEEQDTRRVIFHEGVHWYVSGNEGAYPLWLSEGLAEVFSTFKVEKTQVCWGSPIPEHVHLLRMQKSLPLPRLLSLNTDDPEFNDPKKVSMVYAQSWAFVHFLMFGEREGERSALSRYLSAWQTDGQIPDDILQQVLGKKTPEIAASLARYLQEGYYYLVRESLATTAELNATITPAAPATVETALAKFALGSGQTMLARQHAETVVRLAPTRPDGYDVLTQLAAEAGAAEQVLEYGQQAVANGTSDAGTLVQWVQARLQAAPTEGALSSETLFQLTRLVAQAIDHRPRMRVAYVTLAALLLRMEKPPAEDEKLLQQGARLFPNEGMVWLGLAELARKRGDQADARALLARAKKFPGSFSIEGVNQVDSLAVQWDFEDAMQRVEKLYTERKLDEALQTLSQLETDKLPIPLRSQVRVFRQRFAALTYEKVTREIIGLAEAQRFGEALVLVDGLLKDSTLSIAQRSDLAQKRARLEIFLQVREAEKLAAAGQLATARQMFQHILDDGKADAQLWRQIEQALARIARLEAANEK